MATKTEKRTTSWADESDEHYETEASDSRTSAWGKTKQQTSGAWGSQKGTSATSETKKDVSYDKDYPAPGLEKPSRQTERNDHQGREERPSRDNYHNDDRERRDDYHNRRDNYSRDDRDKDYSRDRDHRDDYDRRRNYDNRDDRYSRRNNRPHRNENTPREPVPFPQSPPFTAFVGNLHFDSSQDDIINFFSDNGCKPTSVRLLFEKSTGKPKGFGYVEFDDLESLKNAVALSGKTLLDRTIRVDVAEAKPEDKPKRENWGRPARKPEAETPEAPVSAEEPKERKKLDLKPRGSTSPNVQDEKASSKANPFGDAKPRDENAFLKKIEDQRKQRVEPPKESSTPTDVKYDSRDKKEDRPRSDKPFKEDRQRKDYPDRRNDRPRNDRSDRSDRNSNRRDDRREGRKEEKPQQREERPARAPKKEDKPSDKSTELKNQNIFAALPEEDE